MEEVSIKQDGRKSSLQDKSVPINNIRWYKKFIYLKERIRCDFGY